MIVRFVFLFFLIAGIGIGISAESKPSNSFRKEAWEDLRKGMNYGTGDAARKKGRDLENGEGGGEKRYEEDRQRSGNFVIPIGGGGQFIMYLLFIGLLILILYFIIKNTGAGADKKIRYDNEAMAFENIEERIHETDLERLLSKSLEEKNFLQSIRLLYLIIIKDLSEKELIYWQKNKTNRDYYYEIKNESIKHDFLSVTRLFEWAWYGSVSLDEEKYSQMENKFNSFRKLVGVEQK